MSISFDKSVPDILSIASAAVTAAPVTIAAWFNPASEDTLMAPVTISSSDNDDGFQLALQGIGTQVVMASHGSSGVQASTSTAWAASTWFHGCAVFASSTSRAAYLNGGGKGTDTASMTPTGLNRTNLGVFYASGSYDPYDGLMAEIGIWDVALSDGEVAVLATGASPLLVRPGSLIRYVPGIRSTQERLVGTAWTVVFGAPGVGLHTRVFYPSNNVLVAKPAAAAGGGIFTPYYYRAHVAGAA